MAETHSTSPKDCGCRSKPESTAFSIRRCSDGAELPDDLDQRGFVTSESIVCSMLVSTMTGEAWKKHLKDRADAAEETGRRRTRKHRSAAREDEFEESSARERGRARTGGAAEERAETDRGRRAGHGRHRQLLGGGAASCHATPNRETRITASARSSAIEGLVELGMTPSQAIVAAHEERRDRVARLAEFGTIEAGKRADLLRPRARIRSPTFTTSARLLI